MVLPLHKHVDTVTIYKVVFLTHCVNKTCNIVANSDSENVTMHKCNKKPRNNARIVMTKDIPLFIPGV